MVGQRIEGMAGDAVIRLVNRYKNRVHSLFLSTLKLKPLSKRRGVLKSEFLFPDVANDNQHRQRNANRYQDINCTTHIDTSQAF